jgi:hypothetical protein
MIKIGSEFVGTSELNLQRQLFNNETDIKKVDIPTYTAIQTLSGLLSCIFGVRR